MQNRTIKRIVFDFTDRRGRLHKDMIWNNGGLGFTEKELKAELERMKKLEAKNGGHNENIRIIAF